MILENEIIESAEQGLLGILLSMPSKIDDLEGLIDLGDFVNPLHMEIYHRIIELHAEQKAISPITVGKFFIERTDMPEYYLADLAGNVVSATVLNDYANSIRAYARKRRLLTEISRIQEQARFVMDTANIETELFSFLETTNVSTSFSKTKKEAMAEVVGGLSKLKPCFPTNIRSLDAVMGGGVYEGYTYGIAGSEKSGKTTTAQTISFNLNQSGVKHAYIAMEMGSVQIEQRNIARYLGVNSLRFLEKPNEQFTQSVFRAVAEMPDNTIYCDMAGCTFDQIKNELHRLVRKEKIKGFILDYWQLISGCDSRQSKSEFLFEIAQWVAAFCRRNKVFSIVLSQLNRDGKLLGSAGIERACDQLYIIESPEGFNFKAVNMRLTHSRYTHTATLGSDDSPAFCINQKVGPYLEEI